MRSDAPAIDKHTIGFAAQLLSMTSWYGRSTELAHIAESMFPGIASTGTFTQQGKEMGIDLAHFSIAVRLGFWIEPRPRGMGAR